MLQQWPIRPTFMLQSPNRSDYLGITYGISQHWLPMPPTTMIIYLLLHSNNKILSILLLHCLMKIVYLIITILSCIWEWVHVVIGCINIQINNLMWFIILAWILIAWWILVAFKAKYAYVWAIDVLSTTQLSNPRAVFNFLLIGSASFHVGFLCLPDLLNPAVS